MERVDLSDRERRLLAALLNSKPWYQSLRATEMEFPGESPETVCDGIFQKLLGSVGSYGDSSLDELTLRWGAITDISDESHKKPQREAEEAILGRLREQIYEEAYNAGYEDGVNDRP